jgi:hypothetical protein
MARNGACSVLRQDYGSVEILAIFHSMDLYVKEKEIVEVDTLVKT